MSIDYSDVFPVLAQALPDFSPSPVDWEDRLSYPFLNQMAWFVCDRAYPELPEYETLMRQFAGLFERLISEGDSNVHDLAHDALEYFSYCCRALKGSLNQALASSAVSIGSSSAMAWSRACFVRAFGCAQQLFELGPCLFDGVQVRRVRRQVEQLGSCRFNSFAHSFDLVRTEIVHDYHVANAQFRAQDLIQIGEEYLPIRGRFDGHGGDHAARADGAQNGEDFPSAVGGGFMNARASRTARVTGPLHPPGALPCRRDLPSPAQAHAEILGQLRQAPVALVEGLKQLAPQIIRIWSRHSMCAKNRHLYYTLSGEML